MTKYKNKKQTLRQKKLALRKLIFSASFRVVLLSVIVFFGILYIVQMSSVSTKGFVISDLQKEVQLLEQETQQLNVKIAQYRSMNSIQERLKDMNLVSVNTVEYVTPVGTAVARR